MWVMQTCILGFYANFPPYYIFRSGMYSFLDYLDNDNYIFHPKQVLQLAYGFINFQHIKMHWGALWVGHIYIPKTVPNPFQVIIYE